MTLIAAADGLRASAAIERALALEQIEAAGYANGPALQMPKRGNLPVAHGPKVISAVMPANAGTQSSQESRFYRGACVYWVVRIRGR
jgi:hypothetical protein